MKPQDRVIRLLACDDRSLLLAGIRSSLAGLPDLCLIGEARDARQVVALARDLRPDVVLLCLPLAGGQLLGTVEQLRGPGSGPQPLIMVMAGDTGEDEVLDAVRAGVRGVVSRTCSGPDLLGAVRAVGAGRAVLTPDMTSRLVEFAAEGASRPAPAHDALTPRELEVLTLVAQGLSDSAIAHVLWVSKVTVRSHLHRTIGKLGMTTRAQAVAYFYQNGLSRPTARRPATG